MIDKEVLAKHVEQVFGTDIEIVHNEIMLTVLMMATLRRAVLKGRYNAAYDLMDKSIKEHDISANVVCLVASCPGISVHITCVADTMIRQGALNFNQYIEECGAVGYDIIEYLCIPLKDKVPLH